MTTLLIDGDIFVYRAAASVEKTFDFDGIYSLVADADEGKELLDQHFKEFAKRFTAQKIIVAFTDRENFRKSLLPTYKANRKNTRKPILLEVLQEHLKAQYKCYVRPKLEADDILGILATNPKIIKGERIIISTDKDLRTVPALHWNPDLEGLTKRPPTLVSKKEADFNFYCQILSGDSADNYKGCEGIGKKRAAEILANPTICSMCEVEIKTGRRKGQFKKYWQQTPTDNIWASIVSHYEKAGSDEEAALVQARVARILRHEDYNYILKEPILWTPTNSL